MRRQCDLDGLDFAVKDTFRIVLIVPKTPANNLPLIAMRKMYTRCLDVDVCVSSIARPTGQDDKMKPAEFVQAGLRIG